MSIWIFFFFLQKYKECEIFVLLLQAVCNRYCNFVTIGQKNFISTNISHYVSLDIL